MAKRKTTAEEAALVGDIPRRLFNRTAVNRTLAAATEKDTEPDFEGVFIEQVLISKSLNWQAHFDTVSLAAVLFTKFQELSGTQRQALFSDPGFVGTLYRHIRLAFPEQGKDAFNVYFQTIAERAPQVMDEIQRKAEREGGA